MSLSPLVAPALAAVDFDPFAGPEVAIVAPSTEPQREIWTACRLGDEASLAFNESSSLRLKGELDVEALRGALGDLVTRHESLRTTLSGDGTTLCIGAGITIDVPFVDLSTRPATVRERALREICDQEVERPFTLERGPLFRAQIVRVGLDEHVLVMTAHHIVCDGWSTAILVRDLGALYGARRRGTAPTLPPCESFSAYARAQAAYATSKPHDDDEAFWLDRLKGALPVLELPLDRPRRAVRSYRSAREDITLPKALVLAVKKSGAKHGSSLFVTLLAAFEALVHRLSGQDDFVIGVPAAGQASGEHGELVGHAVNTLAIRALIEPSRPFLDLLRAQQKLVLDAFDHQALTLGSLLKKLPIARDPSRPPLVSILFNVDQPLPASSLAWDGIGATFASNPRHYETFDLFVNAVESHGDLVLECQLDTDLLDVETVRRWMRSFASILEAVGADIETPVNALPIVTDADRAPLALVNATDRDFPRDTCAHVLIEQQVDRTPDAIAVCFGDESVTYAELDRRANRLARHLRARGVGRDTLVGLGLERSIDMVVALLAILKAGGGYVPIDPAFPRDRVAFMLEDSKLEVLVTQPSLIDLLATPRTKVVLVADATDQDDGRLEPVAEATSRAYVIYTSGSTGKPKGVELEHRAVVNFLSSVAREPGLGPSDVLLAVTTLSFDIAVLELYLPLVVGARVVIASRDEAASGEALLSAIRARGVTTMQATPSTFRLLLAAGWSNREPLKVLCGGEALPVDLARELSLRSPAVWNMYGPTETTVWSTLWRVPSQPTQVRIGKPLGNTQVHVRDARMEPLPVGVPGELFIGGEGLARGYLDRPELTRERFVSDPSNPGSRLYKTGDLVRLLADGTLEYLGRNDDQVKLRGYRIELGEIESALARHPGVAQAAVVVREVRAGDARLVAFVVPRGDAVPDDALRAHLRTTLPEYMVPQGFVALAALPLTPNGKVDRKGLPAMSARDDHGAYREPKTDGERCIAALWQEILGVGRVGADDDFFLLGGHSLLAAQMLSRLARDHGIALSLGRVFEASTVARFAALIDRETRDPAATAVRIPTRGDAGHARQSLMQQRLWFLEQLEPGKTTYNLPAAYRLRGELDRKALEASFTWIARRHESMRTALAWEDDRAVQVVLPRLDVTIDVDDLSALPPSEREAALSARLRKATNTPFDLTQAPLFRVQLFTLAEREHVLFFMPHHAIWDGWSFDTFLRELDAAYAALSAGEVPALALPPIQYADFAEWHHTFLDGAELKRQSAYWTKKLAGARPNLELPTDHPRPAAMSGRGGFEPLRLSRAEVDALTAVAKREGVTLYMLMLAAFVALLHRHTNQRDLLIGTPVRGRAQPETEDLLGFFVNTLVLRADVSADAETNVEPTFRELLARVRVTCLEAFAHPDMPFELLLKELDVARDLARTPIFQAFFSFQDATRREDRIGSLPFEQLHVMPEAAQTDLTLWVMERTDGLVGGFTYNLDVFAPESVLRVQRQMKTLLSSVVEDADRSVATIPIVPEAETRLVARWNATEVPFPREACAHGLFEAQARRTPEAVAVRFEDQTLTYRELDARAESLARRLRANGIRRGTRAGLAVDRSIEMVVGIFGVLKAGGAYVPLDPAFPRDRLAFMCDDAKLTALVTTRGVAAAFPHAVGRTVIIDVPDEEEAPPLDHDGSASPEDAAYVIYTSGSTGRPKGVVVPHRAVVSFLTTMAERPGLTASDVVLAVTTLSFDIAVLELYLPLTVGAQVVVASQETTRDGASLLAALQAHGVTMLQATPSTFRVLIDAGWNGDPKLKALCGGEALPLDLAGKLLSRAREVWNMYGPTETTVWSTCFQITGALERVPIGRPIGNTQCHVLGANLEPVPIGVRGELYIGGEGVALEYLGRPDLTAARFVRDPFASGRRMYRTGDHARWTTSGDLEFLGRDDGQVKVRGHRIEPGEIEARLLEKGGMREACVAVREETAGDARIVAWYVPLPGPAPTQTELRKHLRAMLPEYMVPQHFVELDALPRTPNGKVDRNVLPSPFGAAAVASEHVPPATDAEKLVAAVWRDILGVMRVSAHDNFFNLGGHSLLVLRAIATLERQTGKRLSPRSFVIDTLAQLAVQLPATPKSPERSDAPNTSESGPAFGSRSIRQRVMDRLKRTLS